MVAEEVGQTETVPLPVCVQGVTDDGVDIKDFSAAETETAVRRAAQPSYTVLSKALSTFTELRKGVSMFL